MKTMHSVLSVAASLPALSVLLPRAEISEFWDLSVSFSVGEPYLGLLSKLTADLDSGVKSQFVFSEP